MFAKVAIGVDGTEPAQQALIEVAPLVKAAGGEFLAIYVRHLPVLADTGAGEAISLVEETLDEISEQAKTDTAALLEPLGIPYEFVVREGEPGYEILASAHEHSATMVAIGATMHGAVAAFFVGSVADHLVHHCDLPLLIVRPLRSAD
jgi:nucleotide-binding universal stress UspA family protein